MESNNALKEIDVRNGMCHCCEKIIKIEDFDFCNILLDETPHNNISYIDWCNIIAYQV